MWYQFKLRVFDFAFYVSVALIVVLASIAVTHIISFLWHKVFI